MKLVIDYIIALTNLYGVVSREKVIEIYNMQNRDKIKQEDIDIVLKNHEDDLEKGFSFPLEDYFIHKTVSVFDEFEEELAKKRGKPYYISDKKELLMYSDRFYFERNQAYRKIQRYVERKFYKDRPYLAEELYI